MPWFPCYGGPRREPACRWRSWQRWGRSARMASGDAALAGGTPPPGPRSHTGQGWLRGGFLSAKADPGNGRFRARPARPCPRRRSRSATALADGPGQHQAALVPAVPAGAGPGGRGGGVSKGPRPLGGAGACACSPRRAGGCLSAGQDHLGELVPPGHALAVAVLAQVIFQQDGIVGGQPALADAYHGGPFPGGLLRGLSSRRLACAAGRRASQGRPPGGPARGTRGGRGSPGVPASRPAARAGGRTLGEEPPSRIGSVAVPALVQSPREGRSPCRTEHAGGGSRFRNATALPCGQLVSHPP